MEAQIPHPTPETTPLQIHNWPTVPNTSFRSVESDSSSTMDVDSIAVDHDRTQRATSVLSMDDLEAAQALEGLRSDYGQSPSRNTLPPPLNGLSPSSSMQIADHPEPFLSLLTSQHPLVASAINGSMSAYTSSKSYSPRFKYGAEFIERNIGSPVANTVGSVGRRTGVEGVARWALQRRDSLETNSPSKRRKVSDGDDEVRVDVERGTTMAADINALNRRASDLSFAESLPAYDDQRSPQYEEVGPVVQTTTNDGQVISQQGWKGRLAIHTSGLGVAMSEESLRSLKYCLTWLRWANNRLGGVIVALRKVLKEWEESKPSDSQSQQPSQASTSDSTAERTPRRDKAALFQRIQALKSDVLSTLKQVVDIVSNYAGGALPENARILVRRQLTSLPQRFQIASHSAAASESAETNDMASSAHRVMVLAQEGLGMMSQVSLVVNDTLVSAESWCEKLGRKKTEEQQESQGEKGLPLTEKAEPSQQPSGDVVMGGGDHKA